jgi:predicted Fe-Mo cluster-binding NifX family protein
MKKIAIPINNNVLDSHFGHCKEFAVFKCENKEVISKEIVKAPKHEPGVLPKFLADLGATDVIVGGMGQRAIMLLKENGVNVFVGAPQVESDEIVNSFLSDSLECKANYCDH